MDMDVDKNANNNSTKALSLTVRPEMMSVDFSNEHTMKVLATVTAPATQASRAPVNIVAVIDKSGSMAGSKLKLVQEALCFVAEQLSAHDQVATVVYDSDVTVLHELTPMDDKGKIRMVDSVKNIVEGSSTNLSGGLLAGIQLLLPKQQSYFNAFCDLVSSSKSEISANSAQLAAIWLFTDGLANEGLTKSGQIIPVMKGLLSQVGAEKVSVYTFGFGHDHDAKMLSEIATAGNGMYYYLNSDESIANAFADCLGGLLSVVAQNVQISIKPVDNCAIQQVFTKFNVAQENNGYTISVGDLFSESTKDIIFSVKVAAVSKAIPKQIIATITMRYTNILTCSYNDSCSLEVFLIRDVITPADQLDNVDSLPVDVQYNRVLVAVAMDQANSNIVGGDLVAARGVLSACAQVVSVSHSAAHVEVQSLLADLKECDDGIVTDASNVSKILVAKGLSHWSQRSTNGKQNLYQNPTKKKLLGEVEKQRRKQLLQCSKCGMTGHYAKECLQQSGTAQTTEEKELQQRRQTWLCNRCKVQGHLSYECLQTNKDTCHCCGQSGHFSSKCPDKDKCHFCGLKGHVESKCPKKNDTCNKCGASGHFAASCPTNNNNKSGSTTTTAAAAATATATGGSCHSCGGSGHFAASCPNKACHKCGEVGHFAANCSQSKRGNNSNSSGDGCHNCGKPGHFSRECPDKRRRH